MPTHRLVFRRLATVTTALCLTLPVLARAQDASTPPARVGQLANIHGNVSFNGAGSNGQWVDASQNYPVTVGDSLFTQSGAQAALVLGSSRLSLAPDTELQVTQLDDTDFTATLSQGEVFLNLTDLQQGQNFTVNTPRGNIQIGQNGEYDINSGDANAPTTIAVLSGSAAAANTPIPAGEEASLSGTNPVSIGFGQIQRDQFIDQSLAELSPPPPPYAPPVVQQMTGTGELSSYGTWDQSPQYGAVWYPNVAPGWAPYREGHWAYVSPWGWTWVESEPWGFAPFHYGRWIDEDDRWGWVPAADYQPGVVYAQPVYAPALVGFFGLGAGIAVTAELLQSHAIGWVPLAPREVYYPTYRCPDNYVRRINRMDVRDDEQIGPRDHGDPRNFETFANRHAATYVPAATMMRGDSVARYGHPVPHDMFQGARPVPGNFNETLRPAIVNRPAPAPHGAMFVAPRGPGPGVIHGPGPQMPPGTMSPGMVNHPPEAALHTQPAQPFTPHINGPQAQPQMPRVFTPQGEQGRPEGQIFHPQNQPMPPQAQAPHPPAALPPFHPTAPQFHPQGQPMPQVQTFHPPAPTMPPQAQQFHPQTPQFHPPAPAFQPPAPAFHPSAPAFQPPPQFHPQPAPQFHPTANAGTHRPE